MITNSWEATSQPQSWLCSVLSLITIKSLIVLTWKPGDRMYKLSAHGCQIYTTRSRHRFFMWDIDFFLKFPFLIISMLMKFWKIDLKTCEYFLQRTFQCKTGAHSSLHLIRKFLRVCPPGRPSKWGKVKWLIANFREVWRFF